MSSNRDIWVNRCRQKIPSRFSLAQAAVLRWEQLLRGARPRVTTENPKWMETPLREIATDAVSLDTEEFVVNLAGTPYEPPRPEPGDELDDLLGGALSNIEGGAMKAEEVSAEAPTSGAAPAAPTSEAVPAVPTSEAAPAAEGTLEKPASDEEPVEAVASSETGSDAEGAASDEDKEKTETQTGDAA